MSLEDLKSAQQQIQKYIDAKRDIQKEYEDSIKANKEKKDLLYKLKNENT